MPVDFFQLKIEQRRYGTIWTPPAPRDCFPPEEWAPAIADVINSNTFLDQRRALTAVILGFAVRAEALKAVSPTRARVLRRDLVDARFRAAGQLSTDERLASINLEFDYKMGTKTNPKARIGYQQPDTETPNPAFAVIDRELNDGSKYHEVTRLGDEELTRDARFIGSAVASKLMFFADHQFPGAEIFGLVQELVPVPAP